MKLVHIVGFITKKFVTMHGHMNVKYGNVPSENSLISRETINFSRRYLPHKVSRHYIQLKKETMSARVPV